MYSQRVRTTKTMKISCLWIFNSNSMISITITAKEERIHSRIIIILIITHSRLGVLMIMAKY